MAAVTISVADLRESCMVLLDHLASLEEGTIQLEMDYFWSIPETELYNVYSKTAHLTVGQLSESWENLAANTPRRIVPKRVCAHVVGRRPTRGWAEDGAVRIHCAIVA
jgi:hypothetical protein